MTKDIQERLGITDDFILAHRVDLHNTLRDAAAKKVGGHVNIRLSSRVVAMVCSLTTDVGCLADAYQDAEAGRVTLEDGTVCTGDLIIGADGIHVRKNCASTLAISHK